MVKNHNAGEVWDLEEVFRLQELSRSSGTPGQASPGPARVAARAWTTVFGHASAIGAASRSANGTGPRGGLRQSAMLAQALDKRLMPERRPEQASSGGGAVLGEAAVAVSAEPLRRRQSSRYWTFASVSALVAVVVAGATAGDGRPRPVHAAAQGQHATERRQDELSTSGAATADPTDPGAPSGAMGSGVLALSPPPAGPSLSGNEPRVHVTSSGAATTTGPPPPSSPQQSSTGAPVAAGFGSDVPAVGSSVTGLASQVGSAVPAAAPATDAGSGAINAVDRTAQATTF